MGEMCHFLGREFVCGIFSWPAGGHGGILFGYDVDRESAEYAVEDLVKVIRIIGGTPGLDRIHFVAHSRGTDTLASALAALSAEAYTLRKSSPDARVPYWQRRARRCRPRRRRRGDEDFQSLLRSRLAFRRGARPGAIIPPSRDSGYPVVHATTRRSRPPSWLFGSIARLGRIDATMFTPDQID